MPDWALPPDIRFDHTAALAAAEALAELRFVLANAARTEQDAAEHALRNWEGISADRFATSARARRRDLDDIDRALRLLEAAVLEASADAHRDQRRVDLLQAQWLAEDRAERVEAQARDRYATN